MNEDQQAQSNGLKQRAKALALRLLGWLKRHPRLLAVAGFVSGLASFVLVDRQPALAQIIALLMVASWAWLMFEDPLRRLMLRRLRVKVPRPAMHFVTQMVHQESLFFVLPFFFFTLTWNSGQLVFMGLLVSAAIVSLVDPIYYNRLAPRRWLYLAFHSFTLFAVTLTALPIIFKLTTAQTYPIALGVAVVLALPSLSRVIARKRWWGGMILVSTLLVLGASGWMARLWVPPATLWLTDVSISFELDAQTRTPGESLRQLDTTQLHQNGLFAYTSIRAPRGLNERIYHVWFKDGKQIDRIALDIRGGRDEGYRAWTHKENFPELSAGRWRVRVVTEANQMIGVLRFEVTDTP